MGTHIQFKSWNLSAYRTAFSVCRATWLFPPLESAIFAFQQSLRAVEAQAGCPGPTELGEDEAWKRGCGDGGLGG